MRIAIIGSGISGLTCGYLLSDAHEIVVYESEDYVGGHTCTVDVKLNGTTYAVDTGFIVFNEKTYPNFVTLMRRVGVTWQPSQMSFSVKCARTGLEFSPSTLNSLFTQRRNLFNPSFYRMLLDVRRFKRGSEALLHSGDDRLTLEDYLRQNSYSQSFTDHFIIPMGAAIWSADPEQFKRFPAHFFVQFFENHGFLNVRNQPRWLTIKGGSRRYIEPLTRRFKDGIRLNSRVTAVRRFPDHVEIRDAGGAWDRFDAVVVAAHSDQALGILEDPTDAERGILGRIRYQENQTVLHTDASMLPRRKAAWASWNYYIPRQALGRVALTYDMNILQSIIAPAEFCVSLNLTGQIDPSRIIREIVYHHPVYDPGSLKARRRLREINGANRTYFAGAYWGYGFHEDGVNSALEVCRHFGMDL